MSNISKVANKLSEVCFNPYNYLSKQQRYREIKENEKCNYYIPDLDSNKTYFIKKHVYKKIDYNYQNTIKMVTLFIPGLLAGYFFKVISLLSSKNEGQCNQYVYLDKKRSKANSSNSDYFEMTRRVKNLDDLEAKMESLEAKQEKIAELVIALNEQNWKANIFENVNYPLYILLALKEKKITSHQFGTSMLYWSINQCHANEEIEIRSIPLFLNGKRNPEAEKYIKQTLNIQIHNPALSNLTEKNAPLLDEKQFSAFFEQLAQLPLSEQQLFVIPDNQGIFKPSFFDLGLRYFDHTISQETLYATGFNVFNRLLEEKDCQMRMLPTVGIMQTFLNVIAGENAVQINPCIGLSSLKDIRQNGLKDTRDMGFPFPGVALPPKADRFPAPWYDFPYHDFYHCFMVSMLSSQNRKKMVAIADAIENFMIKKKLSGDEALANLHAEFLDIENPFFRKDFRHKLNLEQAKDESLLFWKSVGDRISTSKLKALNMGEKVLEPSIEVEVTRIIAYKTMDLEIPSSALMDCIDLIIQLGLQAYSEDKNDQDKLLPRIKSEVDNLPIGKIEKIVREAELSKQKRAA